MSDNNTMKIQRMKLNNENPGVTAKIKSDFQAIISTVSELFLISDRTIGSTSLRFSIIGSCIVPPSAEI